MDLDTGLCSIIGSLGSASDQFPSLRFDNAGKGDWGAISFNAGSDASNRDAGEIATRSRCDASDRDASEVAARSRRDSRRHREKVAGHLSRR
jgi:hypothetical protein